MEGMAVEFPDIYQQFMIPSNVDTEKTCMKNMEYEEQSSTNLYYPKYVEDTNRNMTAESGDHNGESYHITLGSKEINLADDNYDYQIVPTSMFGEVDEILDILEVMEKKLVSHSDLPNYCLLGCQLAGKSSCVQGDLCPLINSILGLDEFQSSGPSLSESSSLIHNVVVLRQTPQGLVKLQESLLPLGQEEVKRLQSMSPQEQVKSLGLNTAELIQKDQSRILQQSVGSTTLSHMSITAANTSQTVTADSSNMFHSNVRFRPTSTVSYRPPPNAVLVRVPPSALQVPNSTEASPSMEYAGGHTVASSLHCSECDTQFHDNKSLIKHTRNQHQVYQCNKCGEETVGYYRMASHTKKNHSKEPAFYCQCGRNFSEKRGLTKHQNSCNFYNYNH